MSSVSWTGPDRLVRTANTPLAPVSGSSSHGSTSEAECIVRAYEPHPPMINPLAFVHTGASDSTSSPKQPSSNGRILSARTIDENIGHGLQLAISRTEPRSRPKTPMLSSMLTSARPVEASPLSIQIPDRCQNSRYLGSRMDSPVGADDLDESLVKETYTPLSALTHTTPFVIHPLSPTSSLSAVSFDFSPTQRATPISIQYNSTTDRSRTPQPQQSVDSEASFQSFATGITSPTSEEDTPEHPKGKGKSKAPLEVDEGRSSSPITTSPITNTSIRPPFMRLSSSNTSAYRAFDWLEFERSLTASPGAGPSSFASVPRTDTFAASESPLGLSFDLSSPISSPKRELEDDERTEYFHAHSRIPSNERDSQPNSTITEAPATGANAHPTSSAIAPLDRIPSRTQSLRSASGVKTGKLRKKSGSKSPAVATPLVRSRRVSVIAPLEGRRSNNRSEPSENVSSERSGKTKKKILPSWLLKVKESRATPQVALDTNVSAGFGSKTRRGRPKGKGRAFTEPYPATFSPDCTYPYYPTIHATLHDMDTEDMDDEQRMDEEAGRIVETRDMIMERDFFGESLPWEMRILILRTLVDIHEYEHEKRVATGGNQWNAIVAAKHGRYVGRVAGMRELVRISRVSKTWQHLCFDGQLWAMFPLSSFGSPIPLSTPQLLYIMRSVSTFTRVLDLQGFNTLKSFEFIDVINSISFAQDLEVDLSVTQLREINLVGCRSITTYSLHNLLRRSPMVEILKLAGLECVVDTTVVENMVACTKLVYLDVSRCSNLGRHGITSFANSMKTRLVGENPVSLKVLKLSRIKYMNKNTLVAIAHAFPNLEALDVSWCSGVNDEGLRQFVAWDESGDDSWKDYHESIILTSREAGLDPGDPTKHTRRLTKLRHLSLSGCRNITDTGIGYLAHMVPNLELLELASIGGMLRNEGLARLLRTIPKIRKLDLEDATELTDAILETITPGPPLPQSKNKAEKQPGEALEHLIISYAQEISPEAMIRLIRWCRNLKVFEADNTRISSTVVREFVNRRRARERRERSASGSGANTSGSNSDEGDRIIGGSEIVAIDSRWVSETVIREMNNSVRPRHGFRSWEARELAYEDGAAVHIPVEEGGGELIGPDECDEARIVVKTFQTWSNVDSVMQQREKRKSQAVSRKSHKESKNGSPREEGDERGGCIIM